MGNMVQLVENMHAASKIIDTFETYQPTEVVCGYFATSFTMSLKNRMTHPSQNGISSTILVLMEKPR
jgi:hypothetical protein